MKNIVLRFLVWNMCWMTRYAGFIARPLVRLYADREVIACGLREMDGSVSIIYTPWPGHREYRIAPRKGARREPLPRTPARNFSGTVVLKTLVPTARIGERYAITAQDACGRLFRSPDITIKERTVHNDALLAVSRRTRGSVTFEWKSARYCDPLIYFFIVEDDIGATHAALYTRETRWTYPDTHRASLSVGPAPAPPLTEGASYTAKLLLVDFDGWVSYFAERTFIG